MAGGPVVDWQALIRRFDGPGVQALAVVGSHARGDPNPFSDVDLVRFTAADAPPLPGSGSHLVDGRLVVVGDCSPQDVETAFTRPEVAVSRIPGLREGRALRDAGGFFGALQARAEAFVWNDAMQARADAFANQAMVGWVEEVHKGLAGLRSGDVGRLLDAEYGLSWGLNRLVEVQRGIPLAPLLPPTPGSDAGWSADWFARAEQAIGPDTEWARLRRQVFAVPGRPLAASPPAASPAAAAKAGASSDGDGEARADGAGVAPPLRGRVVAGLWFYVATAELLAHVWAPPASELIGHAVHLIRDTLGKPPTPPAGTQ